MTFKKKTPTFVKLNFTQSTPQEMLICMTIASNCNKTNDTSRICEVRCQNVFVPLFDCHPTNKDVLIRLEAIVRHSS